MASIIENQVSVTRPLFYEGLKATENLSYKKTMKITSIVLAVLFVLLTIGMFLMGSTPVFMAGEFLFFGGLLFWMLILQPKSRKKNAYKMLCKASSDVPKRTSKFYPNHFTVVTDTGKTRDFQYEQILQLVETENLYVLIDESGLGILLDKAGFKSGSIEEIKEYLTEDCQISRI